MMFRIKTPKTEVICGSAKDVFNIIKEFADHDTFWDDAINDEVGEDICLMDKWYQPSALLKAVDRQYYDELCVKFWDECEKDVIDEIEQIAENEITTVYGFEVRRC